MTATISPPQPSSRSAVTPLSSTPPARPRQPAWTIATAPSMPSATGRQSAVSTIAPTLSKPADLAASRAQEPQAHLRARGYAGGAQVIASDLQANVAQLLEPGPGAARDLGRAPGAQRARDRDCLDGPAAKQGPQLRGPLGLL